MRYIVYAEQNAKGRWHGYLQQVCEKADHGGEGFVPWMDPTKEVDGYDTEKEALDAALKLASDNGLKAEFVAPAETDYRMGKVELASKEATGTDSEKMAAIQSAETAERERVSVAIAAKAGG